MASINTEVEIDPTDYIDEIGDDDLIDELKLRGRLHELISANDIVDELLENGEVIRIIRKDKRKSFELICLVLGLNDLATKEDIMNQIKEIYVDRK